ncbi:MAG: hypothetical protein E5Y73_17350 [Mesorhizobium sp.]|uniref:hypothetical protein n=1 Tax=Mesorhizobium sp. TaxID=1871066 RepID=UPI00120E5CA6|nr:hypothetical protein [Mesorhizobium sp.]TIL91443.1 MAG: hypothetical protein E5Y73_17350 [Mesorhizobium sp.]
MSKFKTFSDALTAAPVAANDNKRSRKKPEPRYRGTLPALRWLYDNHPELAEPVAEAVQSLATSSWEADAVDNDQEIRPTVGELVRASMDDGGEWLASTIDHDSDGNSHIRLGSLKFVCGELVEYGRTRKGRKLQPRDRVTSRTDEPSKNRNPTLYVFRTGATTPSPLHAEPYQRPFSGEPALAPMYDPQTGVEANRAELRKHGVDGSVSFEDLPFPATKCPTAIAKGAEFLGGVAQSSGTASSGAIMWEAPEAKVGEARKVIEEIASGATLKDIGERMGYDGVRVDRMAKAAIIEAARVLVAANDNSRKKNAA